MFSPVDPKQSFPKLEEKLLEYWATNKTFEKSVQNPAGLSDKEAKDYVFYDGPPFATGLPHYGHLLAGTLKDVVPRYWTMQGYRIERKWGWDCHGLPVENIVEKELNLSNKREIEAFGIDHFNEACRAVVLRYAEEWKKTVNRMGRWVDMEDDYKTMNPEFMESIWWVFKSLWDKDHIYEGNKVVPYCPRCATPLSNFETNQGYKDRQDPAVTAKFELVDEPGTFVLAWTTTPWTLPSNLALAVGPELTYAKIRDKNREHYILALDRLPHFYKIPDDYEVVDQFLGKTMEGWKYKPVMDYFEDKKEEKVFTVATGNFVTLEDGTGIVHMAPYGEDDMNVIRSLGVELVDPLDAEARFLSPVDEFKGMSVFEANPLLIKKLKDEGKLIRHETINHSYPHCWRCDTPLIYRPISTWFVKVEEMKKRLLKNNQKINWMPDHIQEGRFGKWLEGARDWAISRNRYWGTPLPIWRSASGEIKVVGSIQELCELTGQQVDDLHKHKIDDLTIPCENPQKVEITYVRHGETDHNKNHLIQGDFVDLPLNETGQKQAKEVAEKLKNETFDLILCSPLLRAKETAEAINQHLKLEIVIEPELRERDFGDWEGKNCMTELFEDGFTLEKIRLANPPNGETLDQVAIRQHRVLQKYLGKKVLIVGHAQSGVALHMACNNQKKEEVAAMEIHNVGIHSLTYTDCLRRVPEVLDCWFESGSMPYAQLHYPFENEKKFKDNFPAQFIAEGLDQTRGWFYTLHVLSTALFDEPAFKNCIVNGIILAEDGQKMSKRLSNYPDPHKILDEYGADALRFYLMNSPVVKADALRFSEKGVNDVVRNMILPLWNAYSFFVTYANIDGWKASDQLSVVSDQLSNKLDQWILSRLNDLIALQVEYMNAYDLQKASNSIYQFVDDLTNWYIRRSRRRFWNPVASRFIGTGADGDKNEAYQTLHTVLVKLSQVIAPFMPFVSEEIYRNLMAGEESVHLTRYPVATEVNTNQNLCKEMNLTKTIVSLGLATRARAKIKVRQPLAKVQIALGQNQSTLLPDDQLETLREELNVKEIQFMEKPGDLATVIAKPNAKLLGPRYGKEVQAIIQEAKNGNFEKQPDGAILVAGKYLLSSEEMEIAYLGKEGKDVEAQGSVLVALDTTITPELKQEGLARDLVRQIQELRKAADYKVDDRIQIALIGVSPDLLTQFGEYLKSETLATSIEEDLMEPDQFAEFEGVVIKVKR